MALRRNSLIISEEIHFYGPGGMIGFIKCKINRGGEIRAVCLKSPKENQGRELAKRVLRGRAADALKQHRAQRRVRTRFAAYIPKKSLQEGE